eukprot:GSMAST32.ASY1.ANO1.2591.1 assembled CDS
MVQKLLVHSSFLTMVRLVLCTLCLVHSYAAEVNNNWAVLVGTSKWWYNYQRGIPDSQIILMLADDMPCNPRNVKPGTVFNDKTQYLNLYGEDVEVDFRGTEVTVRNFLQVLTGRQDDSVPVSKRLQTDANSNILIYMSGHGGDTFLKFQDFEELHASDIGDALAEMYSKNRYNEVTFIVDTCQAGTLFTDLKSPNIVGVGSSRKGKNSWGHHMDVELGVSVIDEYSYHTIQFFEKSKKKTNATMQDYLRYMNNAPLKSKIRIVLHKLERKTSKMLVSDFFGSHIKAQITNLLVHNKKHETLAKEFQFGMEFEMIEQENTTKNGFSSSNKSQDNSKIIYRKWYEDSRRSFTHVCQIPSFSLGLGFHFFFFFLLFFYYEIFVPNKKIKKNKKMNNFFFFEICLQNIGLYRICKRKSSTRF